MDDAKVDLLARVFEKTVSRRWLVPLVGAVIGTLRQQKTWGSQLGPPTCRKQGAVCTLTFWLLRRAHVRHLSHQHQLWHLCPRRGRDGLDRHHADLPV